MTLPNLLAMTAGTLVSIAETWYVGYLGIMPLAGMALVFPLVMLQQMLSAGSMGGGIASAVSRALGANDLAKANALVLHAALIALAIGLFFTVLFAVLGEVIFSAMGGKGEALEQCLAYAQIVFLGSACVWLTNAFAAIIRGSGNMRVPSKVLLVTSLVQVVLSGLLGLGWGPVPSFGMAGIASGLLFAFTGSTLYLFFYLRSEDSKLKISFTTRLSRELFMDILKVGVMSSISSLQTVATIVVLTTLMASFGPEVLAGYGVGTRLEFLLVPITFAFGVACLPMVGMALGAKMVVRAKRVAWTGALMASVLVGLIGLVVTLWPSLWSHMFTANENVLNTAGQYFHWVGPCYGFFALGLCLYFASQGAGKLLGTVLAGTVRLVMVIVGGIWLTQNNGSIDQMFALIALGMVSFGVLTALAVWKTKWGD
ncbi:MAG: MATE family efflux transporter [Burkholderiales bacterium]|nr:MATE family efflux transporter [Burkholderiales bacterium]